MLIFTLIREGFKNGNKNIEILMMEGGEVVDIRETMMEGERVNIREKMIVTNFLESFSQHILTNLI